MDQQVTLEEFGVAPGTEEVSFRDLVPEISTTYGSHGMYYYPARFIPQVVRWFILKYTSVGDWIVDPFAGSGTVGVEALATGRSAICIDLNPIIKPLLEAKTYTGPLPEKEVYLRGLRGGSQSFEPRWSRIRYWYPAEILSVLERLWGAYYERRHPLVLIALFRTSRRFSYADEQIPKICRTRRKIDEIEKILTEDYGSLIESYFVDALEKVCRASLEFREHYRGGECVAIAADILNYELERDVDHLLTSPPYGRAHEYIRSFKLELAWLGYGDGEITELTRKEIPYRSDVPDAEILSRTYKRFRRLVGEKSSKLLREYDAYFKAVVAALEKIASRVREYVGIFVGNATYGGITPPYDAIFVEHFESLGFKHVRTYVDAIKSRKLFRGRKNVSPNGIGAESLVVLKAKA